MFLTTNRISTFDAAFKSRFHVAIKYRALSASSRRDFWKTFARKASPNSAIQWMDDSFLDTLSAKDLNGRQIKNIVRTAHAMAVSSNEAIGAKHIESAMEILEEFERDFEEDAAADADRMGGHGMLDSSRGPKRRRLE
jgi:AAA+ superfamily predicted ATPase